MNKTSHNARGRFEKAQPVGWAATGFCFGCGTKLAGRKRQTKWCSMLCRDRRVRVEKRSEAQLLRPRCLICSDPIRYGQPGVGLTTRTCGKRYCAVRANRWFGRMSA